MKIEAHRHHSTKAAIKRASASVLTIETVSMARLALIDIQLTLQYNRAI